jgi:hypothetical protein
MTISQAYYRMIFQELGVTDEALDKCFFAQKLITQLRVNEMINQMEPQRPVLLFNPDTYMQLEMHKRLAHQWYIPKGVNIYWQ